ncbi:HK97 gp10 family phage protein [Psychrosphaera sp. 1_MG-2023]|uniref:HK97-gp10 family putative phage morphogenesis protein n=1 Tax=Psychrosphaera sp. 1_MG-2023 TaxID=3062643 RepID=UPI0026E2870B|nr:HK97-gp10 family putative phage morphogenesis protein [Psychrosphaera sp. 1_MG-2023]MDO6718817.1 HK97 gp10 family phage protein [Psychrosphaera sp. 1_MG-2023]
MKFDFDVEGLKNLETALENLNLAVQNRVLRKAVREASKPIKRDVEARISNQGLIDTGALVNDVKVRVTTDKKNKQVFDVGAKVGFGKASAYKAYWLEFGVEPHILNPNARRADGSRVDFVLMHPGFEPKPILQPSLEENNDEVVSIAKSVLAASIQRAIK